MSSYCNQTGSILKKLRHICILFLLVGALVSCHDNPKEMMMASDYGITNQVILDNVENGVHVPTGLKAGLGIESVLRHCVSCHSSKLITQNRATADGWKSMIDWMYATQNLPQLGDQEGIIIKYLSEHYGPVNSGRRQELTIENWYQLD